MKSLTRFLVAAMFIGIAVELNTNLTAPVQPGYVLKAIPFSAVHHQQAGFPRLRLWESTSGNWSGYAVPMEGSGVTDVFSGVQGSWNVPAVTGAKRTDTYSSVWVGLDGYESGTVEQVGTEQDWAGTSAQNYAWFEMYPSGAWGLNPADFPVSAGDNITASVEYQGTTTVPAGRGRTEQGLVFNVTITDLTKKWTFSSYPNYASYTTVASAQRASAEWVVEAPSSRTVLPLADFGAVNFAGCQAIGKSGTIEPISFWPDDPMTMIDPSGGGAVPSALSTLGASSSFSVAWAAK